MFLRKQKALHRPRSFTVQPRFLIGVQHAPLRLFIGLFSKLFNFELVQVIEEDQEISQRRNITTCLVQVPDQMNYPNRRLSLSDKPRIENFDQMVLFVLPI
ncbi:hypothetical protein P8452_74690 [Trifolium repens]|nr:hypothetical protein P8452_74690 [Trifolium repens]